MASSSSTQKPLTIKEQAEQKVRSLQVAAQAQTLNETTAIPADREAAFRKWIGQNGVKDLDKPDSHYDYRGAFVAGATPDATGHWPDTFKQHGHPTFSVESQYSQGQQDGGHWQGSGPDARFVPPSDPNAPVSKDSSQAALTAFGPAPVDADTSALDGFLTPQNSQGQGAVDPFLPSVVTSRDPLTDSITQHPDFPIPLVHDTAKFGFGTFADLAYGVAANIAHFLGSAALGAVNMTLGSASADVPVVSEEEAKVRRAAGQIVETPAGIQQNKDAVAMLASVLAEGAAPVAALRVISPLAAKVVRGMVGGAAFSLTEHVGQEGSLLPALYMDTAMFGGLSLLGGILGKLTKPVVVGADQLVEAGLKLHPEAARGTEYGKALYEEIQSVADDMKPETFAEGVPRTTETVLDQENLPGVTRAHSPDNISILRRIAGSPSEWEKTNGVVGEASARVQTNLSNRAALARRLYAEWDETLNAAQRALIGGRLQWPAKNLFEREELGKLLDTAFRGEDLPPQTPPNYVAAHKLLRDRLMADREVFRLQKGGSPKWGLDAYLAHVWVGDLAMVNAETNAVLRPGVEWDKIGQVAAQVIADNPGVKVKVVPREWIIPTDIARFGISGEALAPFIDRAAQALGLDPAELGQVITENNLIRVKKPGVGFFGHTQERAANLPGYVTDPFKALRIYAHGASRNMAFFGARQQVDAILSRLGEFRGTSPSIDALRGYVDGVMGKPSQLELLTREAVKQVVRKVAAPFGPGVQLKAEDFGEGIQNTGRNALSLLAKTEAISRLGYNPIAWLVQLSQTVVNTASDIGYGPTMRGVRLLYDKNQQAEVDALLRAGDIRLSIPISDADAILRKNIGVRTPFSPLYLFNRADTGNRAVAFLAAYQDQILKGQDAATAIEYAKKFTTRTNFDYSAADTPRILQGQVGSTIFQFKKYFLKEIEFVNQLSPAGKARFAANVVALFGTTGLFTLPPLALVDWATGELTGETINERLQRYFPHASRGLPGMVANVDLGGAGSIGTPRGIGDLFGPGVVDLWGLIHDGLAPWMADEIRGKGGNLTPKDRARIISQLMPTTARRLGDMYDILHSGQVSVRGTDIPRYTPEDPKKEAFLAAFGIKSVDASEEQRVYTTLRRQGKLFQEEKGNLLQEVVGAYHDGNEARMSKLLAWGAAQDPPLILYGADILNAIRSTVVPRAFREATQGPKVLRPERLQQLPPFLFPR